MKENVIEKGREEFVVVVGDGIFRQKRCRGRYQYDWWTWRLGSGADRYYCPIRLSAISGTPPFHRLINYIT